MGTNDQWGKHYAELLIIIEKKEKEVSLKKTINDFWNRLKQLIGKCKSKLYKCKSTYSQYP